VPRRGLASFLLLALASCAASDPGDGARCQAPAGHSMLLVQMFFGRNVADHAPVSESEWADFVTQEITPRFPAGLSVMDARGQWRDPQTGDIVAEPAKILLIAVEKTPDALAKFDEISRSYRSRFAQKSVGLTLQEACGSF
jgi:hypothetical protein